MKGTGYFFAVLFLASVGIALVGAGVYCLVKCHNLLEAMTGLIAIVMGVKILFVLKK